VDDEVLEAEQEVLALLREHQRAATQAHDVPVAGDEGAGFFAAVMVVRVPVVSEESTPNADRR
jgi:hypothetical protein